MSGGWVAYPQFSDVSRAEFEGWNGEGLYCKVAAGRGGIAEAEFLDEAEHAPQYAKIAFEKPALEKDWAAFEFAEKVVQGFIRGDEQSAASLEGALLREAEKTAGGAFKMTEWAAVAQAGGKPYTMRAFESEGAAVLEVLEGGEKVAGMWFYESVAKAAGGARRAEKMEGGAQEFLEAAGKGGLTKWISADSAYNGRIYAQSESGDVLVNIFAARKNDGRARYMIGKLEGETVDFEAGVKAAESEEDFQRFAFGVKKELEKKGSASYEALEAAARQALLGLEKEDGKIKVIARAASPDKFEFGSEKKELSINSGGAIDVRHLRYKERHIFPDKNAKGAVIELGIATGAEGEKKDCAGYFNGGKYGEGHAEYFVFGEPAGLTDVVKFIEGMESERDRQSRAERESEIAGLAEEKIAVGEEIWDERETQMHIIDNYFRGDYNRFVWRFDGKNETERKEITEGLISSAGSDEKKALVQKIYGRMADESEWESGIGLGKMYALMVRENMGLMRRGMKALRKEV